VTVTTTARAARA